MIADLKQRVALAAVVASLTPLSLCACPPAYPPAEPDVVVFPPMDGSPVPGDVPADCRIACESLAKLGCPESAPSGVRSCGQVCAIAEDAGNPLNTLCVANASNADQMRACGVRCEIP